MSSVELIESVGIISSTSIDARGTMGTASSSGACSGPIATHGFHWLRTPVSLEYQRVLARPGLEELTCRDLELSLQVHGRLRYHDRNGGPTAVLNREMVGVVADSAARKQPYGK